MSNGLGPKERDGHREGKSRWGLAWKAVSAVLIVILALLLFRRGGEARRDKATFVARRGPLEIVVLEGGTIEPLQSREYQHQVRVRGRAGLKILSIVEEGYQITEEDIRNGKILVQLDDTDLQDRLVQEERSVQDDMSDLLQARQEYKIRVKQNESDIQAAALRVKFARMDLEKYLGAQVTDEIIQQLLSAGALVPEEESNLESVFTIEAQGGGTLDSQGMSKSLVATVRAIVGEEPSGQRGRAGRDSGDEGDDAGGRGRRGRRGADANDQGQPSQAPAERDSDAAGGDRPRQRRAEGEPEADEGARFGETPDVQRAAPDNGNNDGRSGETAEVSQGTSEYVVPESELPAIDFSKYAKRELLGNGEAQQRLRTLEDQLVLAQAELALADGEFEGTQRLAAQGFVTQMELNKDEMAVKRARIRLASAETAGQLFVTYEFPKTAEKLMADYVQADRNLRRAKEQARAMLVMAESRLMAEERQYELRKTELAEVQDSIDACKIQAEDVGTVVYGSSIGYWEPDEERIKEGATVRRRRRIIAIPDTVNMGVRMSVHESAISKLAIGQKARVRVDAYPDTVLHGEVVKFDVLPDPTERMFNPDVKVYATSLRIEGVHDWLKTGMTAQLEVVVGELEDVIYIPTQAVMRSGDDRVCYVVKGEQVEQRAVETGEFTDSFIEIRSGLEEGEEVLLQAPQTWFGWG